MADPPPCSGLSVGGGNVKRLGVLGFTVLTDLDFVLVFISSQAPERSLIDLRPWVSNISIHQNHMASLLKHKLLGPTPGVSESIVLGEARESTSLTGSWELFLLVETGARGGGGVSHLEVHFSKPISSWHYPGDC